MSDFEIRANAGIYQLTWKNLHIAMQIDRIREDSRGITGELLIRDLSPNSEHSHLHQARLNLLSTTSRSSLVKLLKARVDHIDWYAIIERACVKVLEIHRAGEPVITLADHTPSDSQIDRLQPIIPDLSPSVIYADGGMGKSMLAQYFSVLVATGQPGCGLTPEPGNVLIVDYETDSDEMTYRLRAISAGMEIDTPTTIKYRYSHQALASDIEAVQKAVLEHSIQMIVVDSAAPACGGEPETAEAAVKYFTALRSLKIASITIAHVRKDERIFGSVYWRNYPRRVFRLTSTQEAGESNFTLGLVNEKSNWAKRLDPMGFAVSIAADQSSVEFARRDIKEVPEISETQSLRTRVRDELLKNGLTEVGELAVVLDVSPAQVRARLNDSEGKDFYRANGPGGRVEWGVISHEF